MKQQADSLRVFTPLFPFHRELQDAGFDIKERGQIEVKGKGQMTTYFLMGNPQLSEESIMGKDGVACLYREEHPSWRHKGELEKEISKAKTVVCEI